jgi:hypothetical protein
MNGRHIHTLFLLTLQYPKGPRSEDECGLYIHLPGTNMTNRKILYDNYAGMFATFDDFCQVMDQCTNNYECLVIDNTSSNSLTDQVFWYKAEPQSDFKMCNPAFWKISSQLKKTVNAGRIVRPG